VAYPIEVDHEAGIAERQCVIINRFGAGRIEARFKSFAAWYYAMYSRRRDDAQTELF
jgi:hypothetical protein